MKKIFRFLLDLLDRDKIDRKIAEKYLAQSVDLYDLEYRERQLTSLGYLK